MMNGLFTNSAFAAVSVIVAAIAAGPLLLLALLWLQLQQPPPLWLVIDAEKQRIKVTLVGVWQQHMQAILKDNKIRLEGITTRELIESAD